MQGFRQIGARKWSTVPWIIDGVLVFGGRRKPR